MNGNQDDDDVCDECGATIPVEDGGSVVNRHHRESCSLFAADPRPRFTVAALENIAETAADWVADLHALRTGATSAAELLARCLDGADADRTDGWRDYAHALEVASDNQKGSRT